MSTQTSAAVQNENIGIDRGKGIVQNENLQGHKGIAGANVAVLKPENKARKDGRKALADLSSAKKPLLSGRSKGGLAPKEKSGVRGSEKTTKKVRETNGLTDEEGIEKCEEWAKGLTSEQIQKIKEWAKEGIERCHFTGNDAQKLEKDIQEEWVSKEVEMVMSGMREWNQMAHDWGMPPAEEDYEEDIGVIKKLEPVPELPSPPRRRSLTTSDDEDPFLGEELGPFFPSYSDYAFELKLKEERVRG